MKVESFVPWHYSYRDLLDLEALSAAHQLSRSVWSISQFSSGGCKILSLQSVLSEQTYCDVFFMNPHCFLMMTSRMNLYERRTASVHFEDLRVLNVVLDGSYTLTTPAGNRHSLGGGRAAVFDSRREAPSFRDYNSPQPITTMVLAGTTDGLRSAAAGLGLDPASTSAGMASGHASATEFTISHNLHAHLRSSLALAGPLDLRAIRCRSIAAELMRLRCGTLSDGTSQDVGQPSLSREWMAIARIRSILENAPEQGLSLAQLSRAAGVSRSWLTSKFRETTGCSIGEYRIKARIDLAARLIEDGIRPLADVAYRVGYAEHASFSRAFQNIRGCSPSAYARSIRTIRRQVGRSDKVGGGSDMASRLG